jgi:hypothetical protein
MDFNVFFFMFSHRLLHLMVRQLLRVRVMRLYDFGMCLISRDARRSRRALSICLERFYDEEKNEVSQDVVRTKCLHYFHRDCLKMMQTKLSCPLCRKDMRILYFI